MAENPLADAHRLPDEAMSTLRAATGSTATDDTLVSALTLCEGMTRQLDQVAVSAVAQLTRRGTFAERGYRSPAAALSDLLGWERFEARRRVVAAEQIRPRVGLDGTAVAARLAATAQVSAAGKAGLRHIKVIARVLDTAAAQRLTPQVWAGAEDALADKATLYTPTELHAYATALLETLDQDGPDPDDHPPTPLNELHLQRRADSTGGTLKGRFEDAALYDAITTLIDAHTKPLTATDDRTVPQRQAEALADICGHVLDHGDVPECGGRRPHLNVLVHLKDLETRCRTAMLDFGGTLTPETARMLACDACVIPIVLNGAGQPLDVGRATRTIPDGLRRAVAARDSGCAFPGHGRPPAWCECHHILGWEHDGETKLPNLVMLCRAHPRLLHHNSGWDVHIRDGCPSSPHPPGSTPPGHPGASVPPGLGTLSMGAARKGRRSHNAGPPARNPPAAIPPPPSRPPPSRPPPSEPPGDTGQRTSGPPSDARRRLPGIVDLAPACWSARTVQPGRLVDHADMHSYTHFHAPVRSPDDERNPPPPRQHRGGRSHG